MTKFMFTITQIKSLVMFCVELMFGFAMQMDPDAKTCYFH